MKITPNDFASMQKRIGPHMPPNANERERWDALWASKYPVTNLYSLGVNDDHVDTALRRISKERKNP